MSHQGKLFFFCGKMGAGKSTKSKAVACQYNAVLISEDEWLAAHFPDQIQSFDDYIKYASLIKPFVKKHVQGILNTGVNVVMDFPANTVRQRQWFLALCLDQGCNHELLYINVSDEQCLSQLGNRRSEQPERTHFDTEEVFHQVTQYFEPPSVQEGLNITLV